MYCQNCGKAVPEASESCPSCGAKVSNIVAVEAPRAGVKSSYGWAWKILWPNFWILLLVLIIYMLISSVGSVFSRSGVFGSSFSTVFSIFVGMPLAIGYAYVFLKAARREKFEIQDVFAGFKTYWNSIGAGILTALIVIGGFILLVVPGIIFACKLAFVSFLIVDRKMGPTEAIKTSWRMTRGQAMAVFGIGVLGILLVIAGAICLGVGAIIALMWIELAVATLYFAVSARQIDQGVVRAQPGPPAAPAA